MAGTGISTVKCSNCAFPVPLDDLPHHICSALPSLPKPTISPGSVASLLPTRLQNLVIPPSSFRSQHSSLSQRRQQPTSVQHDSDRARSPFSRSTAQDTRGRSSTATQAPTFVRNDYRPRTPPVAQRGRDREPYSNPRPLRNGAGSVPTASRTPYPSEKVVHPSPWHTNYAPSRDHDIDTKIGGEAGMAGVGRRGFAAAVRAGMIVPPSGAAPGNVAHPIPGMDGRRANAPAYLYISNLHPTTPPLSPNSHSSLSHPPSPISPPPADRNIHRSPSPSIRHMPSESRLVASINAVDPTKTPTGSAPSTPRLPFFEKYKNKLPGVCPPVSPLRSTQSPQPETRIHPPAVHLRNRSNASNKFANPSSSSSGSERGLAYANSTGSETDDNDNKLGGKFLPPSSSFPQVKGLALVEKESLPRPPSDRSIEGLSKFSSGRSSGTGSINSDKNSPASIARALGLAQVPVQEGRYSGGPGGPEMARSGLFGSASRRNRSASSSASGSSIYSKSTGTGTGTGGLERAMETLLEDMSSSPSLPGSVSAGQAKYKSSSSVASSALDYSSTSGKSYRSKTVRSPELKGPRLPSRSLTSPTARDSGNGSKRGGVEKRTSVEKTREKKRRRCVKCQMYIDDGRWVQMDEGSVLCEKCWKNMYLPKCRRCDLPIENQAVSSSDGQLKGKYHRACFNCNTCYKPFPDKTFYVFDGKPLCAYHYHEANNSLCTAARCGQPIEGPCAVSHSGDRYHPEHFLCEYAGYRPCRERLVEYWEVDGMMLCELHANKEMSVDADLEESPMPSARAMKRVTRFIDLAGRGGGGSNAF